MRVDGHPNRELPSTRCEEVPPQNYRLHLQSKAKQPYEESWQENATDSITATELKVSKHHNKENTAADRLRNSIARRNPRSVKPIKYKYQKDNLNPAVKARQKAAPYNGTAPVCKKTTG